jgi:4-hydroxymandelate oxidase
VTEQRRPPLAELITAFEFEEVAKLALSPSVYANVEGSNRAAFDRITLHPRLLVPMLDLDLSVDLFGETHYTPIVVGPVSEHRQFHADAEIATVRGASAGQAAVVISSRSSVPITEIAAQAKTPLWFSVYADAPVAARAQVDRAIAAGCKVICIASVAGRLDWKVIEQIRKGLSVPVVIKGVMSVDDAQAAIGQGARGIVVSNYGLTRSQAPIEALPTIADAIAGKVTVLIDGSFRRGSDILKALALGAQGVLLARPIMWALSAYGADGVRAVIEMLQSDLARHMGAVGAENLKSLNRSFVRIHRR